MFNESPSAGRGHDPEELLAQARQALDNEDWSTAVKVLNSILLRHKKNTPHEAYILLSRALRGQDKLDRAEKIIQQGLTGYPDSISMLTEYADIARIREDWAETKARLDVLKQKIDALKAASARASTPQPSPSSEPEAQHQEQHQPQTEPEISARTRTKKIMWLSPMCALDRRSGAACQMRSVLCTLAGAGWDAYAVNMTLCDGQEEYPVGSIIGDKRAVPENYGKVFKIKRDGVKHNIFYTRSSYGKNLTKEEARDFFQHAKRALEQIKPDVVLTYGSSSLCKELIKVARKNCTTLIFYLANPSYDDPELFRPFDQVLVPSQFQSDYYQQKIGIKSSVLRTMIPEGSQISPQEVLSTQAPQMRRKGFITMINPSMAKGATLFARLVSTALRERPDLLFLAVESRMSSDQWAEAGIDLAGMKNIWWIPNQEDVRTIYARTSILLFPSFWNEASGRSIAEAQLGGIPVLASNHAGMPEQLNGGGFLFDIPEKYRQKYSRVPSEAEVRPWLDTIYRLMDDDEFYRDSTRRALECGAMFHRDVMQKDIIQRFESFADGENLLPPLEPGQKTPAHTPVQRGEKLSRNAPCPCGSGKKAKKCCGVETDHQGKATGAEQKAPRQQLDPPTPDQIVNSSANRRPEPEEISREMQEIKEALGYNPDLTAPVTFNEKMARRRLLGEVTDAETLQDRWQVRRWVQDRAGESVLPEVYQAVSSADQISWDELPESFAIKTSFNGQVRLIPDKSRINPRDVKKLCRQWLNGHAKTDGETPGRAVQPVVMFTGLYLDSHAMLPRSYGFFVFHGQCRFIQVDHPFPEPKRTLYSPDWEILPLCLDLPQGPVQDKPENLQEMIDLAQKLGQGYDFMRVDLYSVQGRVFFEAVDLFPGEARQRFFRPRDPDSTYEPDQWAGAFWE